MFLGLVLECSIAFKQDSNPPFGSGASNWSCVALTCLVRASTRWWTTCEPTAVRQQDFATCSTVSNSDLIMLGLVTHKTEFTLLRRKISVIMATKGLNKQKIRACSSTTSTISSCWSVSSLLYVSVVVLKILQYGQWQKHQTLRRALRQQLDLARNNFLPQFSHLEIDSGALLLWLSTNIYLLPDWGGHLTDKDRVHLDRLKCFLYKLSLYKEDHCDGESAVLWYLLALNVWRGHTTERLATPTWQ